MLGQLPIHPSRNPRVVIKLPFHAKPPRRLPKRNNAAQFVPRRKRQGVPMISRVGVVTFGPSIESSSAISETKQKESHSDWTEGIEHLSFEIGALNGDVSKGYVTFRPNFRYFYWREQWHLIPSKYYDLDERELHRRMKIKVNNSGKRPWNQGMKWRPETIEAIRSATTEAMKRPEVVEKYRKSMQVRLVHNRATAKKRELQREIKKQNKQDEKPRIPKTRPKPSTPRRRTPTPKPASKVKKNPSALRGPKSLEQRHKISEAIRKKWLDPEYRAKMKRHQDENRFAQSRTTRRKPKRVTNQVSVEKYNILMGTISRLSDEIKVLKAQRALVLSDLEAVREIDSSLDKSQKLIQRVREAVSSVEPRLGIESSPICPQPESQNGASGPDISGNGIAEEV